MNKYMIIQHCANFHDEKNIFGVDFGENDVDFVLIPLGLSAAKSMFFGRNQPIKISLGGISRIFFYFMNKYMFMQQYEKFHDEKNIFGVDFGENDVDFVLIPLGLSAAKSMFFGEINL